MVTVCLKIWFKLCRQINFFNHISCMIHAKMLTSDKEITGRDKQLVKQQKYTDVNVSNMYPGSLLILTYNTKA